MSVDRIVLDLHDPPFEERYGRVVRRWLDERFRRRDGAYVAHEPIWGLPSRGPTEGGHARRAARLHDVLVQVARFSPQSVLDVGGAEGYFARLCRDVLDAHAVSVDISIEACRRAQEICEVEARSANASRLPFADDSFDVVCLAEVVEHLLDPIGALLEAARVARKGIVIATEECHDDAELRQRILEERSLHDHVERNVFVPEDFDLIFSMMQTERSRQRFEPAIIIPDETADREMYSAWLKSETGSATTGGIIVTAAWREEDPGHADDNVSARAVEALLDGLRSIDDGIETPAEVADDFEATDGRETIPRLCAHLKIATDVTARLLDLDRVFRLPTPSRRLDWSGEDLANAHSGWNFVDFDVGENGRGVTLSADPQWISPMLCIPSRRLGALRIAFDVESPERDALEIYARLDGDMDFTATSAIQIPFEAVNGRVDLIVPLEGVRDDAETVVQFRIDPVYRAPIGTPISIERITLFE